MDEDRSRPGPGGAAEDLQALARDWITLWQSELAAAAADREMQEAWQALAALWAGAAAAMLRALPRGSGEHGGGAGAAVAARPAPAAVPPDPRDAEIERLHRRIDALEQRLAARDAAPGRRRAARRGPIP